MGLGSLRSRSHSAEGCRSRHHFRPSWVELVCSERYMVRRAIESWASRLVCGLQLCMCNASILHTFTQTCTALQQDLKRNRYTTIFGITRCLYFRWFFSLTHWPVYRTKWYTRTAMSCSCMQGEPKKPLCIVFLSLTPDVKNMTVWCMEHIPLSS